MILHPIDIIVGLLLLYLVWPIILGIVYLVVWPFYRLGRYIDRKRNPEDWEQRGLAWDNRKKKWVRTGRWHYKGRNNVDI